MKKTLIILTTILLVLTTIYFLLRSLIKPKAKQGQKSYLEKDVETSATSANNGKQLPRGYRNNNPGNIKYSYKNDWLGKVPYIYNTDKEFEQFSELRYGVRAMIILIKKKIASKGNLSAVINDYAREPQDKVSKYIDFVTKQTGWEANKLLTTDRKTLFLLVSAMIGFENGGKDWVLSKDDFDSGYNIL